MFKFNKKYKESEKEPGEVAYKCKYCGKLFYRQYGDVGFACREVYHECGTEYSNFTGVAKVVGFKKFTKNKTKEG